MKITGTKVNIRSFKPSDFKKIVEWSKDEQLTYFLGKPLPASIEECHKRYLKNAYLLRRTFAIEDKKGHLLGEIELDHIVWKSKRAELFIYIGNRDLWGKGYGSDALNSFLDYIFKEVGLESLYLKVYQHNYRAIRCYEKCGFKKRGLLRFHNREHRGDNIVLMEKVSNGH